MKKKYNILCMTETHHRYEKLVENELISFIQMREKNQRKGGGLQILMRENRSVEFEVRIKNEETRRSGRCAGNHRR